MRKILPILLAATVLGVAASSAYLAPLYPVYAQNGITPSEEAKNVPFGTIASTPSGRLRPQAINNRLDNLEEKIATRAAALKAKLAKFKDKNKAKRVESINQNLENINKRRTDAMTQNLARISQILERLKAKVALAESAGKDVSALKSAIADVEAKWTAADIAVKTQAAKDYSIVVNTEATVKDDATVARDTLQTDLKAAHTQIVDIRQSIASSIRAALASLGGQNATQ